MTQRDIIEAIAQQMKQKFGTEGSGHDWFHIERVWKNARHIAEAEGADMFTVELAALLHDIADWKFTGGDDTVGPAEARKVMETHGIDPKIADHVCNIIAAMSFKGAKIEDAMPTLEGKVVQDADRLDAIGAIGIARAFAYGGHKNRLLHDPSKPPVMHADKNAYVHSGSPTLNHFYEKLFLLKDRMKTATGRRMAEERDAYMRGYVERFLAEWEGKA
jgi:uncharacterized protein